MALAIAATNTYSKSDTGINSHPINLPAGIVSGDLLLVFAVFNANPTVTDPSGWAVLASNGASGDQARIYAKIADGSEGATVTVNLSGNQRAHAASYRITGNRNGVTSSEISVSTAVDANTATPDPPNLTPSWGSEENLWIAVDLCASSAFTFSSYPTNYSLGQLNVQSGNNNNANAVSVAGRLLTASSEDPGAFTTVTARDRSTYTLAVRPAAGVIAMVGSTSLTFSMAGTAQGKIQAVGSTSLTFATTGAATGKNYITGSTSLTFAASGAIRGNGALVGTSPLTFTPSATIRGKGALAGATSLTFAPAATLRALARVIGSSSITFAVNGTAAGKARIVGNTLLAFSLSGFVYVNNGPGKGRANASRPATQTGVTAPTGQIQVAAAGGRAGVSAPRSRASVSRASGRATVQ